MMSFIKSVFSGKKEAETATSPEQKPTESKNVNTTADNNTEFSVHEIVATGYGTGHIHEVRSDCYVVKLTNWSLAQGQSPTLYLQRDMLKRIPGALHNSTVQTPYGTCVVESIRPDSTHIVRPLNWKLANNTFATLYLRPDQISLTQTPDFLEGDEVMTVLGQGYICELRSDGGVVVKLNSWKLAQGQSPTCFMNKESIVKVHRFRIGQMAKTVWGIVQIVDVRRNGTYVCKARHWHLADGTVTTMYLAPEAFALKSIKP